MVQSAYLVGILLLLFNSISATSTAVEQAPPGTSSLTFVFDTTGSMNDDLVQVKEGASRILNTVLTQREKLIYNFIYVPFNDPGWGPVFVTTDANAFQRHLSTVQVTRGGDCPEMALSGIQLALETALPSSYIYVFTDARAKDYHLEDQIVHLSQEKQSNVVFVMTGDCNDRTHPGFTTFERIAAVSFGQVFHLQKTDVQKVLEYVRHQLTHKKVAIMYEIREEGGSHPRTIPVDSHMSHLEISLSGEQEDSDYLDVSLQNPKGVKIEKSEYGGEGGTLDLPNIKIIRIKNPMPGIWRVHTTSHLKHTFVVNGNGTIQLNKFGFCSRPMDKIELTHNVPVAHQSTYLMVNMTGLLSPGFVDQILLVDYNGKVLLSKKAIVHPKVPYLYYMGPFIPPKGVFYIMARGKDDKNYDFQRMALRSVTADQAGGPKAYMASQTTTVAYESVNLTCSVASRTKFELFWYKDGRFLAGPFFYLYSDTAVWTINQVTQQDQGKYTCRVTSSFGNDSASTILTIKEPVPEITYIRNQSAPVGKSAFLHCRTQTPNAVVEWFRGSTRVRNTPNIRLYQNGTLAIAEVHRSDGGWYRCRVTTAGGKAEATIILKLLESPQAIVYPQTLYFVHGVSFNISCYTTGDPQPEIKWYLKGKPIKPEKHKYYITYKYELIVQNPTVMDAGVYECRARNAAGEHTASAIVNIATPPKLKVVRERQMVNRGKKVVLECLLQSGNPKPRITWYRAAKEIPSYRYIQINEGRLTIQNAQDTDGGPYTCVAQNIAGRDHKNLHIDVGSRPTIVPSPDVVRVNIEKPATLHCRAIGHPRPQTSWKKNNVPITNFEERYKLSPDGSLSIINAHIEDEGYYTCTATNTFGQQMKKVKLEIAGLVAPVLGRIPLEEQLIEGGELRLSCIVILGTPRPTIQWFKDGVLLENTDDITIEGGGSGLHLRNGNLYQEGKYTCLASSPAGNTTLNVNVDLIKKPFIETNAEHDILVKAGEPLAIPCRVQGKPQPKVTWLFDGKPIPTSALGYTIDEDHTLRIYQANVNHAGKYTCIASNAGGEDAVETNVNILTPPVILLGQISFNSIQGDRLTLPCEVRGQPMPKITWYLNNQTFDEGTVHEDGTLEIQSVTERHRGMFRCVAENEAGSDERAILVTVHTVPVIDGNDRNTITANVNDTVKLTCPARATPPPNRTWFYRDDIIREGFDGYSETRIEEDGSLVLTRVQLDRSGGYQCRVSNLAGEDYIDYELKIQDPPRIITDIPGTVDIVLGLMLEVPCRAQGTPEPTITWEKDDLQVIPDNVINIVDGTLRIAKTELIHRGTYRCIATNPAGSDVRQTLVVIEEPPVITSRLPSITTTAEGDRVELKCEAEGNPPPTVVWVVNGILISGSKPGIEIARDNTLMIESVKAEDAGLYSCRASNTAGKTETYTQLTVITKPFIPDGDTIDQESVVANQTISLYCPVHSVPLPQVTWQLEGKPIAEADANVQLSEDKRRLRILKSKVTDAGIYKCIARNPAGESFKMFNVEILVPPNVDQSKYKLKISVVLNNSVEIGCPVTGLPPPDISWLVSGGLLQEGQTRRGVWLEPRKSTIYIASAQLEHQDIYTCVASNKAGTLDIDVQLTVLAPPKVGKDEDILAILNKGVVLACEDEQEGLKSTVSWLVNGSESLPANAQLFLDNRRLYLNDVELENEGTYQCRVRNTAGESIKNFRLFVLAPPKFRDIEYNELINVTTNATHTLFCYVTGNPKPTIEWFKDGKKLSPSLTKLTDNGQLFQILHKEAGSHRYTCFATNQVGRISREFSVQVIAPPKLEDERKVYTAVDGGTVILECPVSSPFDLIDWLKDGKPIAPNAANLQLSHDARKLTITNLQKGDEATFTCIARNFAGKAHSDIKLVVSVSPKVTGRGIEDVEVVEGDPLELECDFEADPRPEIKWSRNGRSLTGKMQLLNEGRTASWEVVSANDEGTYLCSISNSAGHAEKTFNVKVILKPVLIGNDKLDEVEAQLMQTATITCPIANPVGVELTWTKDDIPIVSGTENIQILNGGRHLLISNVYREDQAVYTCIAQNRAGKAEKSTKLTVLVPPTILGGSDILKVTENNTLVLLCEVDGYPLPNVTWNKDGVPANRLQAVKVLSEGQQLKIGPATTSHAGTYFCAAVNKVGKSEITFEVDVITRPALHAGPKETVETVRNDSAVFKCHITDNKFDGEITWLKDFQPLPLNPTKYILSQNNRTLRVARSDLRDEGTYSCRVRNAAGANKIDYKLSVLVPPEIIMLDKDKNRTVIENSTVTLSCPATGKPEPTIEWYKDGELLTANNISLKTRSARLDGNDLKISRIEVAGSGRYTCEAKNKAGMSEQDVLLYVMTPPKIERQGIPTKYYKRKGISVSISCPAYGRPPPVVTWLKSGRSLEYSPETYVSASGMKLHFLYLKKDDAGRYTCIAKNAAGEDKRDFSIILQEPPVIEGPNVLKHVSVNKGRTAIINCPATGSPEPTISWLINGQPLIADQKHVFLNGGRQLQISKVSSTDDARYTCMASNAEVPPKIAGPEVEVVEVIVNNPQDLTCEASGTENLETEWLKEGQVIDFGNIRGDDNYLQVSSRNRRLHILSAQIAHSGRFTCVVKNSAGEARKDFDLRVLVPPTINESSSSSPLQTVIPESHFKIECKVQAIPDAEIIWKRDQKVIKPDETLMLTDDNKTIWVNKATNAHEGRYTCEVINKAGSAKRDFFIKLADPPVVDRGTEKRDAIVGEFVVLTCKVTSGTGNMTIKWLIDDRPVENGQYSETVFVEDHRIQFRDIRLSDAGSYVCVVRNEAGTTKKRFELAVLERPRFMDTSYLAPSIIVGRPLILDCSVSGTPKPTVVWTKVSQF